MEAKGKGAALNGCLALVFILLFEKLIRKSAPWRSRFSEYDSTKAALNRCDFILLHAISRLIRLDPTKTVEPARPIEQFGSAYRWNSVCCFLLSPSSGR